MRLQLALLGALALTTTASAQPAAPPAPAKALPMALALEAAQTAVTTCAANGYKVTAVNDREKDYVEYEIAKGDNSYEVQIDLDPATQTAKKIDVTSNLWEAEATDRATDKKS